MARIALFGADVEFAAALREALALRGVGPSELHASLAAASDGEGDDEIADDDEAGRWLADAPLRDLSDLPEVEIAVVVGDPAGREPLLAAAADAGVILIDATDVGPESGVFLVLAGSRAETLADVEPGARVALPTPAAVGLLGALDPIAALSPLVRVVVTVLRPATLRGAAAARELSRQAVELLGGRALEPAEHPRALAFGLRPVVVGENDPSPSALLSAEVRTLLGVDAPLVSVSMVDVGVFAGLGLAVYLETERPLDLQEVAEALRCTEGVCLAGEFPSAGEGAETEGRVALLADLEPGPVQVAGSPVLHVAGLEADLAIPGALRFFLSFDERLQGRVVPLADVLVRLLERDD